MCGIIGIISKNGDINPSVAEKMRDTLVHRGPDDYGIYSSLDKKVILGHRRLSIIDLRRINGKRRIN